MCKRDKIALEWKHEEGQSWSQSRSWYGPKAMVYNSSPAYVITPIVMTNIMHN